MATRSDNWPRLVYDEYRETRDTLHMYAQILGKLRLALKPPLAQWGHAPLHLTANGLTTGPLWVGDGILSADLDLVLHVVTFSRSDGRHVKVRLGQGTVADFYKQVGIALEELGVDAQIDPMPQELADPIPFDQDTKHSTYDPEQANRLWQAWIRVGSVYEQAQSGFWGKQSPVGLFWGAFDLSFYRYSGRRAQTPGEMPQIMAGAMDAENILVSFSVGSDQMPQASYTASGFPPPQGMETAPLRPPQAQYMEFPGYGPVYVLAYEDVRTADDPRGALLEFCRSSYEAIAGLGGWDRQVLEQQPPAIRKAA
jgi:Family of unknown function (DUF5996)